ncbi:uncharacterized protein LOC116289447 [Actinia tenebrosa]|uniref:Uncharacterized protein LOC116289447 n=1 Tax=Actinia tenebrosa TaxID=6105 RepID=A0A6P8HHZ9_ACTTE|nr:uncharacterized protein LOC116289447 [Actinia tenebrosa]
MDSDDIKWKSVQTTSREILHYSNKITGQQKWTNKNCYCSKPKDPLQPTLPCCYKMPSMTLKSTGKEWAEHSYARRKTQPSLSKKLYCLGDIVNEVQKSFLTKGHAKHKKRKEDVTLDFKDLITTEDPKSDVRIIKASRNDQTTELSKNAVILVKDSQNDVNVSKHSNNDVEVTNNSKIDNDFVKVFKDDVNVTMDTKTDDGSFTYIKDTKNDITTKDNSISDVSVSKDPSLLAKDYLIATKNTKHDVTGSDNYFSYGVTVAKHPIDVIVTADMKKEVSEDKDSDFNNDVTVKNDTRNKENGFNNDVTVVKDLKDDIVATDKENDVSEAKDSNDFVSKEPSKMKEKVTIQKRGLKRKREASDNINGYKGRLRVRRNKIERTIRRKYRRRRTLKSEAVSSESVQPKTVDTPKNPSKKKKLEVDNKVLQADYDLIEQSIVEIDRYTSGYSVKLNKPSFDLGSQRLNIEGSVPGTSNAIPGRIEIQGRIENPSTTLSSTNHDLRTTSGKKHNEASELLVDVSHVRFIDEQFIQMNIPFQSLVAEVNGKKSRKSKTIGSVEKKNPVSRRKRQKLLPRIASSELSSNSPGVTQNSRVSASSSCITVSSVTPSLSSLKSVSETGRESIQAMSQVNNTEESNSKTLSSSNLTNTNQSPSKSRKWNFPPNRNRSQRSLNEIVNCMNSPNKVEVPISSTLPVTSWLTIFSKEAKKVKKSNRDIDENDLSDNGTSLNNEQLGGPSCATDNHGAYCPESEPSVFGHIENVFSLTCMQQTPSVESVQQAGSNSRSSVKHNSKRTGSPKEEAGGKTKNTCEAGANTIEAKQLFQTPEQARNVTEVPACYVDLSWRIVTSNDGHSSSLSNFFKLVPVTIARGPSGTVDGQEPTSFLGVPIHGGPAVIAKILNTSVAQNCNEIFSIRRRPNIETAGTYIKKSTLSFVWDNDAVLVNSESLKAGNLSGKDVKPRPPIWMDNCNRVSIVLPKPLRLPAAGNVIYLGDFNVRVNYVEFVVTHSVVVTKSPRPSLTVPSGTPLNSTSTFSQAIRCLSPGKAKKVVQAAKKVALDRKAQKGDITTFQKCVFCGTELMCQRDVKMHRKLHTSFAGTKCSECNRRFENGGRLSVHLNSHKCHWLHVCAICKSPYGTPKFLTPVDLAKDYYKMCLPCRRKELKCKKCTERLLTFEDLKLHLKEKHGLNCPICKLSFFFKRDLIKHMNIQHGIISPSASTTRS